MRKIITLILAVTLLFLTGCTQKQPLETLRIGVMSDVGAVPFIIAQEQGIFEDLGLKVEIQVFKSAMDRDTALQTGNLDGAMADLLTVVFFNDAKFDVKMTSATYGNYKMVTSPKQSPEALPALSNIKAGISSNTVIDFATDQVAKNKSIDAKMEKIAIPQMPVRLEMLRNGELDVATLPEPLAFAAVLDGGQVVAGTEDLGLYPGVFIMTQTAIKEMPKEIELLYKGYNLAVDEINQTMTAENMNAEKSLGYFKVLVEQLGFPPVLEGKFVMPTLKHAQAADENSFKATLEWMKNAKLTESTYEMNAISTSEFIQ